MSKIIYLHGFASSNRSEKVSDLKEILGESLIAPNLLSKPSIDVGKIDKLICSLTDPIIVGASLGGFYAEYFSRKYRLRSLLINPLLDIGLIEPYIGEHNYYYNPDTFHFSKDDYNHLLTMERELKTFSQFSKKTVLLAKNDAVISYKIAEKFYENSNIELALFENETHSFSNITVLVENIKKLAE